MSGKVACTLMSVSNQGFIVCILFQFCVFLIQQKCQHWLLPTHSPIQWLLRFRAILRGQSGQSTLLTSGFHLMPRLRISGATPLFPYMPLQCKLAELCPYLNFFVIFSSCSNNYRVLFGVCTVYSSVRERFYERKQCNVVLAILPPCDRLQAGFSHHRVSG